MTHTLPLITCRSLLVGKLICRDAVIPRQIIHFKGPRMVHEPFVNEIHSTSFFSRVILLSATPPYRLLQEAAKTLSPDTIADLLSDYLSPVSSLDTGLLISLEPSPVIITVSQA